MAKLREARDGHGDVYEYHFACPGCGCNHGFLIAHPKKPDGSPADGKYPKWNFDGNLEQPTFSPSLLFRGNKYPSGGQFPTDEEYERMIAGEKLKLTPLVCHSFVRAGKIQFLSDCTHAMAGQTVNLPDIE